MGYTHYWDRLQLDPISYREKWGELNRVTAKIVELAEGRKTATAGGYHSDEEVRLARYETQGEEHNNFTNDSVKIAFNGVGDSGHETFYLSGPDTQDTYGPWDFCKTARKPYDVVVVAVLEAASRLELLKWRSDGDESDHDQGIELYEEAVYALANPTNPVPSPSVTFTPLTDAVSSHKKKDIIEHARKLELAVSTLAIALKATKPDCDYDSDEELANASKLRREALKLADQLLKVE